VPEPSQQPQPDQQPPSQQPNQQPADGERELVPKTQVDDARREAMQARNQLRELQAEHATLARRLEVADDRDKSELEKIQTRNSRLEKQIAEMTHTQTRHEVAADRKIPVDALEHVRADDRALLEVTADRVIDYAKTVAEAAVEAARKEWETANPRVRRSSDPIATGAPVSEPLDMDSFIRAGFRR
jgi:hypothetical protein